MSYLWSKSQVESMLSSGLTDKDREDLEEIDKFLRAFIKESTHSKKARILGKP